MNTKIIALTLAAATTFAFTPKPAVAGDKGLAVLGGIVGGLIIGAAIADSHNDYAPLYASTDYPPEPVYVADGYWSTTTVNVWVPGVWIVERDYYGRGCRRYVAAHYERRNDRVWVTYNRYERHDYRHDREIGRGYGYDRYDRHDHHDRRDDRRDDRHDDRRDDRRDHR